MFSRLVASARGRSQFRSPAVIVGSLVLHGVLIGGLVWLSAPATAEQSSEPDPNEEVTYIDITEIPPPPDMVFEAPPPDAQPEPAAVAVQQPAVPRAAPAQPRTVPNPTVPTVPEPAGFQELQTPPRVIGIPPPDPAAVAVNPADFGGRGAAGGTAAGTRSDAGTGRIGVDSARTTGVAGGTGTAEAGPPTGTFSANLVDRQAELSNLRDIVRLLQREYPQQLASTRTEGSVHVQFVITAEGRVDMSTIRIVSATHPEFAEATKKVLQEFRFRPARMGDHSVRMLTELPIQWKLGRD